MIAHDVQMLADIGPAGGHVLPQLADRQLLVLEQTENLQPDGMGNRFEQQGQIVDLVVVCCDHSNVGLLKLLMKNLTIRETDTNTFSGKLFAIFFLRYLFARFVKPI